jgi:hypothetical protein
LATDQRGNGKLFLKNSVIFWQPAGTYCQNMAISEIPSSKSSQFGAFSHKFLLHVWHQIFFCCKKKWQNLVPKNFILKNIFICTLFF